MSLTERSRRSRRSTTSTSESGLTHVTDDPDLRGSNTDDAGLFERPIRGYDPVFAYRDSRGAGFKRAPGDDERMCETWHERQALGRSSKSQNFVKDYFRDTVVDNGHHDTDNSRLAGDRAKNKTKKTTHSEPRNTSTSTRKARTALSLSVSNTDKSRPRTQTQNKLNQNSRNSTNQALLSISSGSRSGGVSSQTRNRSVSHGARGDGSSYSSHAGSTDTSESRPLIASGGMSWPAGRSLGRQETVSDRSVTSPSSTDGSSGSRGTSTQPRLSKRGGLFARLTNCWAKRKKRAQKEFRRKERKKRLLLTPKQESCPGRMRKFIRSLARGQPLQDPTVAYQYGTSGTYRPFGQPRSSMSSGTMSVGSPPGSLNSTPRPGERRTYGKEDYEGKNVIVCSQKKAVLIMCLVFSSILAIALIAAFARPACVPGGGVIGPPTVAPPVVTPPTTPDGEAFPWDDVRLPNTLHPTAYNILIHPNLTTFEVVGQVFIELSVVEETSFIVLHSRNMSITERSLLRADRSANVSIAKLLLYPPRDQMYVSLHEPLKQGHNYTLFLKFSYRLKETLEGFYLSHYISPSGEKRYLATTQFEPNAARAAFPCLDEPQLKATFKLSLVRYQSHTALFNTPRRRTEDLGFFMSPGFKKDDFYPTVKMSTYLVAFVVSDYNHISGTANNDVLVSVWAPPHLVQQGHFALEVAISCLNFYTDYFGIPYQLPKIDLVAVPDFGAGAMENWGLVTFRDTSLLYDSTETSSALSEWVTLVVAHELAHQWFGNLVTMRWWNDLWLNEGFATLMEFIGAGNAKPEFHMSQQFILKATLTALSLDSLRNSHPISVPVTDPDEIESIFDFISYSKGAALLYMLMKEIGQPVFKAGLHTYLSRHMFANAETDDLWAAIQEASQEVSASDPAAGHQVADIKAMMDSWTLQKHYPLVSAAIESGRLNLRQEPFVMLVNSSEATAGQRWFVPVRCRVHQQPGVISVRLNTTEVVSVEIQTNPNWYYCNINKTGLYRVTYPRENWSALERLLRSSSGYLSLEDRGALIDDAFSLNRADRLNATVPLSLSTSLLTERGLAPWTVAERHLGLWLSLLYDQATHAPLQTFVRSLIRPRYLELGWSDTGSHLVRQQRSLILAWAVSVRLPEAVSRARSLFSDWKAGLKVPPDFRKLVYSTGVEYGNESDWHFVWHRYLNASTPSEKKSLLLALGSSQDPLIIENLLRRSLASDQVRTQDFVSVVESIASNEAARLRLWRFVRLHWPEILAKFGAGTFLIDNIIQEVVSGFTTQLELDEVRTFFDGKELRSASRALQQAIESVQLNIRWRNKHQATVANWLHRQNQRRDAAVAS